MQLRIRGIGLCEIMQRRELREEIFPIDIRDYEKLPDAPIFAHFTFSGGGNKSLVVPDYKRYILLVGIFWKDRKGERGRG